MVIGVSLLSVAVVLFLLIQAIQYNYVKEKFGVIVQIAGNVFIIGVFTTAVWIVDLIIKFLGGL